MIPLERVSVVSLCSRARLDHLREQTRALRPSGVRTIVAWLDADPAPDLGTSATLHVPPGADGFRLAAGRNAVADRAFDDGAELVVFLDADCVPGPDLLGRYREAAARHPEAVLSGSVTYLPEGFASFDDTALRDATAPHSARPAPAAGTDEVATRADYDLFWSLSFAVTRDAWRASNGFDERFEGYGGEDTDFGRRLRDQNIPLVWVGGADAYHQYHPTTTPPVQHLDDILRNGALFARLHGSWPMAGWLKAFEAQGLVERTGDGWRRVTAD